MLKIILQDDFFDGEQIHRKSSPKNSFGARLFHEASINWPAGLKFIPGMERPSGLALPSTAKIIDQVETPSGVMKKKAVLRPSELLNPDHADAQRQARIEEMTGNNPNIGDRLGSAPEPLHKNAERLRAKVEAEVRAKLEAETKAILDAKNEELEQYKQADLAAAEAAKKAQSGVELPGSEESDEDEQDELQKLLDAQEAAGKDGE